MQSHPLRKLLQCYCLGRHTDLSCLHVCTSGVHLITALRKCMYGYPTACVCVHVHVCFCEVFVFVWCCDMMT